MNVREAMKKLDDAHRKIVAIQDDQLLLGLDRWRYQAMDYQW